MDNAQGMTRGEAEQLIALHAITILGGSASRQATLDRIGAEGWRIFSGQEREPCTTRPEEEWRNRLARERQNLVDLGALVDRNDDVWEVTPFGTGFYGLLVAKLKRAVANGITPEPLDPKLVQELVSAPKQRAPGATMVAGADDDQLLRRICIHPDIFGGKPIVRGRRLAVEHVLGMLAAGDTPETLLEGYPWLEPDDVRACLLYAQRMVAHERIDPRVVTQKAG